MLELTERALELLVPIIGDRMKLMSKLKKFKDECKSAVDNEPDIIVCSPLRESNSLNKNPTPVNQSKIRYRYLNIIHMFSVFVHVTVFDHAINLSGHILSFLSYFSQIWYHINIPFVACQTLFLVF